MEGYDSDDSFCTACSDDSSRGNPPFSADGGDGSTGPAHRQVDLIAASFPESPVHALHRACFTGDVDTVRRIAASGLGNLDGCDRHGLTALHIAAMRNQAACAAALLEAGFSSKLRSSGGWLPLEEAISYHSKDTLQVLLRHHAVLITNRIKKKLQHLGQILVGMPDCAFQLSWELSSPYLKAMLHKHLPEDTYTVYKRGGRIRIDGHLKGICGEQTSLLPVWKYGSFSLLVNTEAEGGCKLPVYVSHDSHSFAAVEEFGEEHAEHHAVYDDLEYNVDSLLEEPVTRNRVKFSKFQFNPVRGWLSPNLQERVNGRLANVYEAEGELTAVMTVKAAIALPPDATFGDYLNASPATNVETVTPLNLHTMMNHKVAQEAAKQAATETAAELREQAWSQSGACCDPSRCPSSSSPLLPEPAPAAPCRSKSMPRSWFSSNHASNSKGGGPGERKKRGQGRKVYSGTSVLHGESDGDQGATRVVRLQKDGSGRRMSARMWLAKDMPINQTQLLPLLELVGSTNRYVQKVCDFMQKFGSQSLFPVKMQVPLLLSLRATVQVQKMTVWESEGTDCSSNNGCFECPDWSFFEIPAGYRCKTLGQVYGASKSSRAGTEREDGRRHRRRQRRADGH